MRSIIGIGNTRVKKCMTVPISFASNIKDEVTVGNTSLTETPRVDKSKETSACPGKSEDVLAQHTKNIQKQFDTFQSNTVHSLEISFVNAIEKLSVCNQRILIMISKIK